MTRYIAVIYDVGEQDVIADDIAEAVAIKLRQGYADDEILEVRRADFRDREDH